MKIQISLLLLLVITSTQAQISSLEGVLVPKKPFILEISNRMTTVIIFPWQVKKADRGIADVLASKVPEVENAVAVKALNPFNDTTNLHVFTTDGRTHTFTIVYNPIPKVTTYQWQELTVKNPLIPIKFSLHPATDKQMLDMANIARSKKPFLNTRSKRHKLKLTLRGIYFKDEIMFARFSLRNQSSLTFNPGWTQLYITDKKQTKRSSVQQVSIKSLCADDLPYVGGHTGIEWVFAFPKQTLNNKKKLIIEMQESSGNRNVSLEITNRNLLKAQLL